VNDGVFAALADPTRRHLLDLVGSYGAGCSASTLAGRVAVSRQAVTQHLAVLEECHLVTRRRLGREVLFSVAPDEMEQAAAWLSDRASQWRDRLAGLKAAAETGPGV
jgi:DNA-binding transcriptional ArsR family regulator